VKFGRGREIQMVRRSRIKLSLEVYQMPVLNQSLRIDEIVVEKSKKSQGLQKHSPVPMLSNDGLGYLKDFLALQTVVP
jgi:hypothetical protein